MDNDSSQTSGEEAPGFMLVCPFWIDTDAYTDRDRSMFVAGVEFQMFLGELQTGEAFELPIHKENESRIRMACGRFGRRCSIEPYPEKGCPGAWSFAIVEASARAP